MQINITKEELQTIKLCCNCIYDKVCETKDPCINWEWIGIHMCPKCGKTIKNMGDKITHRCA